MGVVMQTFASRSVSRLLLVVIVCLLPAVANSTSENVFVSGNGYLGSDLNGLGVSAGILTAFSAAPDGPGFVAQGLMVGAPVTLFWGVQPYSGSGFTEVMVGGQFTDILFGSIDFNSTFTVPASAVLAGTFTTPVSVSGELQAYLDLTLGQGYYTKGPLLADLSFDGTGTATFKLDNEGPGFYGIQLASVDFKNQGTLLATTPEPSSLLLMATGLILLAGLVRHRLHSTIT